MGKKNIQKLREIKWEVGHSRATAQEKYIPLRCVTGGMEWGLSEAWGRLTKICEVQCVCACVCVCVCVVCACVCGETRQECVDWSQKQDKFSWKLSQQQRFLFGLNLMNMPREFDPSSEQ